jgi:hypothetical protein
LIDTRYDRYDFIYLEYHFHIIVVFSYCRVFFSFLQIPCLSVLVSLQQCKKILCSSYHRQSPTTSTLSVPAISQAGSPQSFFAVLSHKYELADSAEALLSDLSLPNGTTMSSAGTALVVPGDCVFDTVGDAGGEADGAERVGDRGRNVDFCWVDEAMLEDFSQWQMYSGEWRDR